MWTGANKESIAITEQGRIAIAIVYFGNAGEKLRKEETFNAGVTEADISVMVVAELARLNKVSQAKTDLVLGQVNLDIKPPDPDPVVVARNLFFFEESRLQLADRLIQETILKGDEKEVVDLIGRIRAEYKPEYLG